MAKDSMQFARLAVGVIGLALLGGARLLEVVARVGRRARVERTDVVLEHALHAAGCALPLRRHPAQGRSRPSLRSASIARASAALARLWSIQTASVVRSIERPISGKERCE